MEKERYSAIRGAQERMDECDRKFNAMYTYRSCSENELVIGPAGPVRADILGNLVPLAIPVGKSKVKELGSHIEALVLKDSGCLTGKHVYGNALANKRFIQYCGIPTKTVDGTEETVLTGSQHADVCVSQLEYCIINPLYRGHYEVWNEEEKANRQIQFGYNDCFCMPSGRAPDPHGSRLGFGAIYLVIEWLHDRDALIEGLSTMYRQNVSFDSSRFNYITHTLESKGELKTCYVPRCPRQYCNAAFALKEDSQNTEEEQIKDKFNYIRNKAGELVFMPPVNAGRSLVTAPKVSCSLQDFDDYRDRTGVQMCDHPVLLGPNSYNNGFDSCYNNGFDSYMGHGQYTHSSITHGIGKGTVNAQYAHSNNTDTQHTHSSTK